MLELCLFSSSREITFDKSLFGITRHIPNSTLAAVHNSGCKSSVLYFRICPKESFFDSVMNEFGPDGHPRPRKRTWRIHFYVWGAIHSHPDTWYFFLRCGAPFAFVLTYGKWITNWSMKISSLEAYLYLEFCSVILLMYIHTITNYIISGNCLLNCVFIYKSI